MSEWLIYKEITQEYYRENNLGINLNFNMEYAKCSFTAVKVIVHRQGFIWKDFLKIVVR